MKKMKNEKMDKGQLLDALDDALIGMTIPERRKKDIGWLNRNIAIHNEDHPNFIKARWLINQLMKEENK